MSGMVERVGGVLQSAILTNMNELLPPGNAMVIARAVIAAMREPTREMIRAGEECEARYAEGAGCAPCDEHWPVMIDAALKD